MLMQQVNNCDFAALIAALNADEFMNDYRSIDIEILT